MKTSPDAGTAVRLIQTALAPLVKLSAYEAFIARLRGLPAELAMSGFMLEMGLTAPAK